MKSITLNDAVKILSEKMIESNSWRKDYYSIVRTLQVFFDEENVEEAFQLKLSEEEVVNYAKETVLSVMGKQMSEDDIHKIEIISDKKLSIHANGHFYPDESYSCRDAENTIVSIIRIFTGYSVDISL